MKMVSKGVRGLSESLASARRVLPTPARDARSEGRDADVAKF